MASEAKDTPGSDAKPARKGGGLARIVFGGMAFVAGAAAGAIGAVTAGGALGFGPVSHGGKAEQAPAVVANPVEYVELDQAFTSNLADTGRYLQLKLSVSQTGGAAVTTAITQHKPAVVSAILGVLGEAGEADVATREAKDALRLRLKQVINETLKRNGVTTGVTDVFITSLVVQ